MPCATSVSITVVLATTILKLVLATMPLAFFPSQSPASACSCLKAEGVLSVPCAAQMSIETSIATEVQGCLCMSFLGERPDTKSLVNDQALCVCEFRRQTWLPKSCFEFLLRIALRRGNSGLR